MAVKPVNVNVRRCAKEKFMKKNVEREKNGGFACGTRDKSGKVHLKRGREKGA